MNYIIEKSQEIFSNLWVKIIIIIPACFFQITDKEKTALTALIFIVLVDLVLGVFIAKFIKRTFKWSLLGSMFIKKFVLYSIGLGVAHVVSKGYLEVDFLLYAVMSIVSVTEVGDLSQKLATLGFPIKVEWAYYLNCWMENKVRRFFGFNQDVCDLRKTEEEYKKNNYKQ